MLVDMIETLCAPGYVLTAAGTCVREEMLPNGLPGLPEPEAEGESCCYMPPAPSGGAVTMVCRPGVIVNGRCEPRPIIVNGPYVPTRPLPEPIEPTIPEEPMPAPAPPDAKKILPLVLAAAGFLFLR